MISFFWAKPANHWGWMFSKQLSDKNRIFLETFSALVRLGWTWPVWRDFDGDGDVGGHRGWVRRMCGTSRKSLDGQSSIKSIYTLIQFSVKGPPTESEFLYHCLKSNKNLVLDPIPSSTQSIFLFIVHRQRSFLSLPLSVCSKFLEIILGSWIVPRVMLLKNQQFIAVP